MFLGGANQVTSDELAMPADLTTEVQVRRYWLYLPFSVRDFLSKIKIVSDIPAGIPLNKARSQYSDEKLKELIFISEAL